MVRGRSGTGSVIAKVSRPVDPPRCRHRDETGYHALRGETRKATASSWPAAGSRLGAASCGPAGTDVAVPPPRFPKARLLLRRRAQPRAGGSLADARRTRGGFLVLNGPPPQLRSAQQGRGDGYGDLGGEDSWLRLRLAGEAGLGGERAQVPDMPAVHSYHRHATLHCLTGWVTGPPGPGRAGARAPGPARIAQDSSRRRPPGGLFPECADHHRQPTSVQDIAAALPPHATTVSTTISSSYRVRRGQASMTRTSKRDGGQ